MYFINQKKLMNERKQRRGDMIVKNSRKTLLTFIFITALVLTFTACLYSVTEDSIKKSFQVRPGGQLIVDTDLGSIEIITSKTNTLKVEVIREIRKPGSRRAEGILEDFNISFRQDGNTVYVNGEYDRSGLSKLLSNIGKYVRFHFLVSLPEEFNVDLKTSGGSISVDDLKGKVRSKTSGGSLSFSRIKGPVWGRTSGGSIKLTSCTGIADIKTSGGSIAIGEVSGDVVAHTSGGGIKVGHVKGNVDVHTSGGSISIKEVKGAVKAETSGGSVSAYISTQPESDCSLSTSGGSVTVYLADDIGVDVNAKTSSGRVYTDFPVTIKGEISKKILNAKINNGGPELYLHTSGGSIYIKKAD
jgi:hypothetical protein